MEKLEKLEPISSAKLFRQSVTPIVSPLNLARAEDARFAMRELARVWEPYDRELADKMRARADADEAFFEYVKSRTEK